jgi:HAD superfamily hydrolase (TIGR01509 family)
MPLRALLIDFDGTIIDTESPETYLWEDTFRAYGVEFPAEYFTWAVGRGADEITERPLDILVRLLDSKGALPDDFEGERIERDYRRRRLEAIDAEPIRPGMLELLIEANQAKIPCAVVSSSRHEWVDSHLARLRLTDYFVATICADDALRAKPYPDLYELACQKLAVSPEEAVAIEDSPNGVRAAADAKLAVVAVPNPLTASLQFPGATVIKDSLAGVGVGELRLILETLS